MRPFNNTQKIVFQKIQIDKWQLKSEEWGEEDTFPAMKSVFEKAFYPPPNALLRSKIT